MYIILKLKLLIYDYEIKKRPSESANQTKFISLTQIINSKLKISFINKLKMIKLKNK